MIFGLAAGAMAPVLLTGARGAMAGKLVTTAKNLAADRINSMLALPFHIAYQNGDFLDLLDDYYAGTSTSPTAIPATSGTGVYVPSGTVPGQSAASAFYQVSFGSPPEPAQFSQVVDTQFLVPGSSPRSALAPPTSGKVYSNSQPPGGGTFTDQPVSLLVGVTVLTSYAVGATTHTYRTYTEITDTGHDTPLVVARAGATALTISSNDSAGNALSGVIGQVGLTGNLSTTSNATASVLGARFSSTDPVSGTSTGVTGASANAAAPPDAASRATLAPTQQTGAGSPCGWGEFGPTSTSDVSATVDTAQPRAPADVESGATPVPAVQSSLTTTSGSCPDAAFTNVRSGGATTVAAMDLPASGPFVQVPNPAGSGPALTAAASLDTPALTFSGGTHPAVTTTASVTAGSPLELFPAMPFAATTLPGGAASGQALLVVDLTSATISCTAGATSATASYTGNAYLWEQPDATKPGGYVQVPLSWSAGTAPALPALSTTVTWTGATPTAVPLSTWISSWQAGTLVQRSSAGTGLHILPGALSLTTAPTVAGTTPADETAISLTLDQLSCVSEDNR